MSEDGFKVGEGEGSSEPDEVSDERKGGGSWREFQLWEEEIMEGFNERSDTEETMEKKTQFSIFLFSFFLFSDQNLLKMYVFVAVISDII